MQAHGQTAGVIGAIAVLLIGSLVALGNARDSSTSSAIAALIVSVVVAAAVFVIGRTLGSFTADKGMLAIHSDRVEISDAATLHGSLLIPRRRILLICQPGVADTGPSQAIRLAAERSGLQVGAGQPNVEIWLAAPLRAPLAGGRSIEVRVVRMQTPGALALLTWFRSQPMEPNDRGRWEDVFAIDAEPPMYRELMGKDEGNPF